MELKLSIVIINYNTFAMTCDCLRDIYASNWEFGFEVILVDNASVERDPEDFKRAFPQLVLIKSPDNGGFARGNNLGIAVAQGEYLLILNSDTLGLDAGIRHCLSYMDLRKHETDLGGVGCRILSPDGSMQRSAFDYRIGLPAALLDNSVISFVATKLGLTKYRQDSYVRAMHEKEHAVQALLGAFMLLRRDVVEKVKPFDPDFFMYAEETEWCYRINDNGYRLMYIPDTSIVHIGGGSTTRDSGYINKQYYLSLMLITFKQSGYWGMLAFNLLFALNYVTNSLLMPFRSPDIRIGHQNLLRGTRLSLRYQGVMLKYFKPAFASSSFPFKLSTAEELKEKGEK
ncbi:MAG: glycosyltransferase [Hymenobacter sp.]|nr:MAG: glycosyltransferase [Hymenobacter sp.]